MTARQPGGQSSNRRLRRFLVSNHERIETVRLMVAEADGAGSCTDALRALEIFESAQITIDAAMKARRIK